MMRCGDTARGTRHVALAVVCGASRTAPPLGNSTDPIGGGCGRNRAHAIEVLMSKARLLKPAKQENEQTYKPNPASRSLDGHSGAPRKQTHRQTGRQTDTQRTAQPALPGGVYAVVISAFLASPVPRLYCVRRVKWSGRCVCLVVCLFVCLFVCSVACLRCHDVACADA